MTQNTKRELKQFLSGARPSSKQEYDAGTITTNAAMISMHRQNKKLRTSSEDQDALNVLLRVAMAEKMQQQRYEQQPQQGQITASNGHLSNNFATIIAPGADCGTLNNVSPGTSSSKSTSSAQKKSKKNMFLRRTQEQEACASATAQQERRCNSADYAKREKMPSVSSAAINKKPGSAVSAMSSLQGPLNQEHVIAQRTSSSSSCSNKSNIPLHVFLPNRSSSEPIRSMSSALSAMNEKHIPIAADTASSTSTSGMGLAETLLDQVSQDHLNVEVERMIARHHTRRRRSFELLKAQHIMMLAAGAGSGSNASTNVQTNAAAATIVSPAAAMASATTRAAAAALAPSSSIQRTTVGSPSHPFLRAASAIQASSLSSLHPTEQNELLQAILTARVAGGGNLL